MTGDTLKRSEVFAALDAAVATRGLLRTSQGIYMSPIADSVLSWVGIDLHRTGRGAYTAAVVVGVRHEKIHHIVDEARGKAGDREVPTVSTLLGYLMPQNSPNIYWDFQDPSVLEEQSADLAGKVKTYAAPYFAKHTQIDLVLDEMQRGTGKVEADRARIPAALLILGRSTEACEYVQRGLLDLSHELPSDDELVVAYRNFAAGFEAITRR